MGAVRHILSGGLKEAQPVIQMDINGNFIAEFESCRKAARQFGGTKTQITTIYQKALYGRRLAKYIPTKQVMKYPNEAYGYLWKIKRR